MSKSARKTLAAGRFVGPRTLAEIHAREKRAAGGSVNFTPPSPDAIRAAIAEGKCPFCGSGPWKMLPVHTNKVHGVDKWELRDMAGLSSTDPLCSEDSREKMREAALRNPEAVQRATAASRVQRRPRRTTIAGRERNTATLVGWAEANPEAAREAAAKAGLSVAPEVRARIAAAARQWAAENPKTEEQRRAFAERMCDPDVVARRRAARALQPCGTVASYKRGCRCEDCRAAKRTSRP